MTAANPETGQLQEQIEISNLKLRTYMICTSFLTWAAPICVRSLTDLNNVTFLAPSNAAVDK
jgi:hypothetical protein